MARRSVLPSAIATASAPGDDYSFAAQWLACVLPCRRFANVLANAAARLGAGVDRYSFTATDLHRLLLAGLPAHYDNAINTAIRTAGLQSVGEGRFA
jgi:hypothetical protein